MESEKLAGIGRVAGGLAHGLTNPPTKPMGTCLGLAVPRAIARAHGGDMEVGNGESGGALFTLRLPRTPEGRM